MSSHIFAELTQSDPSLVHAAEVLDSWLDRQPVEFSKEVCVSWIVRELSSSISSTELAKVVNLLAKNPKVKIVYRIQDPEGNFASRVFESSLAVPDTWFDQSGNSFDVELSCLASLESGIPAD